MQAFFNRNAEELRGFDPKGGARRAFDRVTDRLASLHLTQAESDIGTRGQRYNEAVLADRLRFHYFRPLTRVAKAMKPKVEVLCAITFPYRRTNTTALVQRARAAIAVARPHQEALERMTGRGFLDGFLRAAAELEGATSDKSSHRTRRTGATSNFAPAIKQARLEVSAMDALLHAHFRDRHPLLTEWRALVREFRSAGRKRPRQSGPPA